MTVLLTATEERFRLLIFYLPMPCSHFPAGRRKLPLRAHTALPSRRGEKFISGDVSSSRKAPPAASLEVKDPTPPGHNLQRGSSNRALSLEVLAAAQERGLWGKRRDWGKAGGNMACRELWGTELVRRGAVPAPPRTSTTGRIHKKVSSRCFGGGHGGRGVSTVGWDG